MTVFPKYGKILNFSKFKDILDDEVVITEKIHGTNGRIMYCPEQDKILVGGRKHEIVDSNSSYDGYNFFDWVYNQNLDLKKYPGYVFHGEFHGSGVQKGVKYTPDTSKDFRVFDVRHPDGYFLSWIGVVTICKEVGLKIVPLIGYGYFTREEVFQMVDKLSVTARENGVTDEDDNIAEGIVIKPVNPYRDHHGEWVRAKIRSAKWAENASQPKVPRLLKPETIQLQKDAQEFADAVVTEGRVHTIIEHITRDGNTTLDLTRTRDFMKDLTKDIWEEHLNINNVLQKEQRKAYNKAVTTKGVKLWKKYIENL